LAANELVDRPIATPDVQFVLHVLTKSQDTEATGQEERALLDSWGHLRQSKDFPTTQVGVEIHTGQRWQACAAVDITANDGTTPTAMVVYRYRAFEARDLTVARWVETGLPLHESPAVVAPTRRSGGGKVHLFRKALAPPVGHLTALLSPVRRCVSRPRCAALRLAPGCSGGAAALPWARGKGRGRGVFAGGGCWGALGGTLPRSWHKNAV